MFQLRHITVKRVALPGSEDLRDSGKRLIVAGTNCQFVLGDGEPGVVIRDQPAFQLLLGVSQQALQAIENVIIKLVALGLEASDRSPEGTEGRECVTARLNGYRATPICQRPERNHTNGMDYTGSLEHSEGRR